MTKSNSASKTASVFLYIKLMQSTAVSTFKSKN